MVFFQRFGNVVNEAIHKTVDQIDNTITLYLQHNPLFYRFTNFLYMGYTGGSLDKVKEIVVRRLPDDTYRVLGFRNYGAHEGRLEYVDDIDFIGNDTNNGIASYRIGGHKGQPGFDRLYEDGGSIGELVRGLINPKDMQDTTRLQHLCRNRDINFLINRSDRRRTLHYRNGMASDIQVIDVPAARGYRGLFRIFDPQAYNGGQIGYGIAHAIVSKALLPIYKMQIGLTRTLNKMILKRFGSEINPDEVVLDYVTDTTGVLNALYGIPNELDSAVPLPV